MRRPWALRAGSRRASSVVLPVPLKAAKPMRGSGYSICAMLGHLCAARRLTLKAGALLRGVDVGELLREIGEIHVDRMVPFVPQVDLAVAGGQEGLQARQQGTAQESVHGLHTAAVMGHGDVRAGP